MRLFQFSTMLVVAVALSMYLTAANANRPFLTSTDNNTKQVAANSQKGTIQLAANTGVCNAHAKLAVAQQQTNVKLSCGMTGGGWHIDYDRHFNWCLTAPDQARIKAENIRRNALTWCSNNPPKAKTAKTYTPPIYKGHVVDNCVLFGVDCGDGGANKFCQKMGYGKASAFTLKSFDKTRIMGTGGLCTGNCTGYSSVTCVP